MPRRARKRARAGPSRARPRARALRDDAQNANPANSSRCPLDDSLGDAHASLAFALDLYGWDWEAAETEYKLAIKLDPGYATAHQWYSWHLMMMGRNSEG